MTTSRTPRRPARRKGLNDAEYKAIGDFRRALREFLAFSDRAARQHGLTSQQHQALLAIRAHSGPELMSVGELADCLLIRNHSALELIGRLVERGLLARMESKEDRRRVLLTLLPEGAVLLERISMLNMGEYGPMADSLSKVVRRARALAPSEHLSPATAKPKARSPAKR
jgi:DNA-binding MarR family transcriptional regulator